MKPTTLAAYKLLHDGVIALAQVEANGMRIDVPYVKEAIKKVKQQIVEKEEALKTDEVYKAWKKRYGSNMNMNSTDQIGKVLFEDMKYKCPSLTASGKAKTDIATLERLHIPFVANYLEIKKLKKAHGTYLKNILKECSNDGFLHPVFNLHLVQTFRSSSSEPNFQNLPIRDKKQGELIRSCFIPRKGCRICECDFSGIEVHAAAFYHKDPVMLDYLSDKTKDMHRDMAQQCYKLPSSEMLNPVDKEDEKRIKAIRYCGKNKFVFPQFYGDWFLKCADSLWTAASQMKLKMRDGTSIKKWLKKQGIFELGSLDPKVQPVSGTFVHHMKEVEYDFWNKRFQKYKQWKDNWYSAYLQKGSFTTLTGFEISGLLKKNEVINYPVQGVAFHCLLWSLIRLQKLLKKNKMKSLIVGQIHDSIVADVRDDELKEYLQLANQVMTVDIKKHWPWIITPIEIEAEVTPLEKSWFEKYKISI